MISIIALDPGESTGWVFRDAKGKAIGGTCKKDHIEVAQLIEQLKPDVVVLERFNLYPHMSKSLAWNSFYPCEVIGVIKLTAMRNNMVLVEQAPSVKKYYGGAQPDWDEIRASSSSCTEHTKDAYMHLRYFERNGLKKLR